ncbi:MAG: hypothetical protein RBU23_05900 [Candidatus Auribacterota bacterium]|jgi:hypothetical protein|nr:hypothetical protein [Candidatus Auribacterota bacterium]
MSMSISDKAWVAMNEYENKFNDRNTTKTQDKQTNQFLSQGHLDTADKIFSLSFGIGKNTDIFA